MDGYSVSVGDLDGHQSVAVGLEKWPEDSTLAEMMLGRMRDRVAVCRSRASWLAVRLQRCQCKGQGRGRAAPREGVYVNTGILQGVYYN